jgi:YidC/Oxa1 family membrane protein insertase
VFFPLGVLLYWFTSNTWTMFQQLYINKYHPQTPADSPEVGALGKSLAPKPGQRPARDPRSRTTLIKDSADIVEPADEDAATPPPRNAPRPGQRPQRQGGNRPPGKRPSQAKKRR